MKFRVNFGSHTLDGTTYRKGDIIETDKDLVAANPIYDVARRLWRFTRLPDEPTPPVFNEEQ